MTRHDPTFAPRLLPAPEAAHYLGVSETTLRGLDLPRRVLGGKRLFDRMDLDRFASELPYDGQVSEIDECDKLFGVIR